MEENFRVIITPYNKDNLTYTIIPPKSNNAIFVDAMEVEKTKNIIKKFNLVPLMILNTHGHYDHCGNNNDFIKEFKDIKIYGFL